MTLLSEARAAGLEVRARGEHLVVRGPREAEPLARRVLEHKTQVMALLAGANDDEIRWRAEAMRPRVPPTGPIPPMYARLLPSPVTDGYCLSCGEPLTPGNKYHCEPCVRAVWIVLRDVRGGPEVPPPRSDVEGGLR